MPAWAASIGPGGTGPGRGRGEEEGEGENRAELSRGRARVPFRLILGAIVHFITAGMTNPRNESLREPLRNELECRGPKGRGIQVDPEAWERASTVEAPSLTARFPPWECPWQESSPWGSVFRVICGCTIQLEVA